MCHGRSRPTSALLNEQKSVKTSPRRRRGRVRACPEPAGNEAHRTRRRRNNSRARGYPAAPGSRFCAAEPRRRDSSAAVFTLGGLCLTCVQMEEERAAVSLVGKKKSSRRRRVLLSCPPPRIRRPGSPALTRTQPRLGGSRFGGGG